MKRGTYGAQEIVEGRWYSHPHPDQGAPVFERIGEKRHQELVAKGFVFLGFGSEDAPPVGPAGAEVFVEEESEDEGESAED